MEQIPHWIFVALNCRRQDKLTQVALICNFDSAGFRRRPFQMSVCWFLDNKASGCMSWIHIFNERPFPSYYFSAPALNFPIDAPSPTNLQPNPSSRESTKFWLAIKTHCQSIDLHKSPFPANDPPPGTHPLRHCSCLIWQIAVIGLS